MLVHMASPSQAVAGTDDRNMPKGSGPARVPAAIDGQWVLQSILPLLFGVGLLYAIATATIGWGNTLNDRHSFRH